MSLANLCGPNRPLIEEPGDPAEILGLLRSGQCRLADAQNPTLSGEGQFDLAYNAAHALSLAALRHHGYRPRHRYIVFQVLAQTLGIDQKVWRVLSQAHEARNLAEYQGNFDVSEALVRDLIAATQIVESFLVQKINDT